ncbi:acetolactate synthase small subunit, partial [Shewanella sp. A25]|nr:acetolactate synthase small subunit [Shewanella shenzhenensis]
LATINGRAGGEMRAEVKRMADIFRGQSVDVTSSLYTIHLAGTSEKLDSFIAAMAEVTKVIEVSRSGVVGLARGDKAMKA